MIVLPRLRCLFLTLPPLHVVILFSNFPSASGAPSELVQPFTEGAMSILAVQSCAFQTDEVQPFPIDVDLPHTAYTFSLRICVFFRLLSCFRIEFHNSQCHHPGRLRHLTLTYRQSLHIRTHQPPNPDNDWRRDRAHRNMHTPLGTSTSTSTARSNFPVPEQVKTLPLL